MMRILKTSFYTRIDVPLRECPHTEALIVTGSLRNLKTPGHRYQSGSPVPWVLHRSRTFGRRATRIDVVSHQVYTQD